MSKPIWGSSFEEEEHGKDPQCGLQCGVHVRVSESNEQGELRSQFAGTLRVRWNWGVSGLIWCHLQIMIALYFVTFLTFSLVQHLDWSAVGLKPVQWCNGAGFLWKYILFHFSYIFWNNTNDVREGVKKIFVFYGQVDHKGWGEGVNPIWKISENPRNSLCQVFPYSILTLLIKLNQTLILKMLKLDIPCWVHIHLHRWWAYMHFHNHQNHKRASKEWGTRWGTLKNKVDLAKQSNMLVVLKIILYFCISKIEMLI